MLKRFSFIVCLGFLFSGCEGDETVYYKINTLELDHIRADNSGTYLFDAPSIPALNYGIRMNFESTETGREGRYFDLYESYVIASPSMKYLYITSNVDFDSAHPAGSLINEYFYYFPGNYAFAQMLSDSTSFAPTSKYFDDYESQNFPLYADVLLVKSPSQAADLKFYIRMVMGDNTEFLDSTEMIHLEP